MTKKIFRSTVAVGLAVLLASLVIIMGALYSYFGKQQEQQLKDELSIAAAAMAGGDGMSYLTRLDSDNYRRRRGALRHPCRCRCHGEPRPARGGAAGAGQRRR